MVPEYCGINCNKTIYIEPLTLDDIYFWNSNGWDSFNYPDDCTCVLNVKVSIAGEFFVYNLLFSLLFTTPSSQFFNIITLLVSDCSLLAIASSSCSNDHLEAKKIMTSFIGCFYNNNLLRYVNKSWNLETPKHMTLFQ